MDIKESATVAEFNLSKIATNDDAAERVQEVEEQIEEDNVERAASESATGVPVSLVSNEQIETNDDEVASREEVEEQEEQSRIDKVAFEDGMSTASAKNYIQSGRSHD
jgi:hypothetical protein